MAKIPSRKFSTAKRKIASTKFSTAKRKLASGHFAKAKVATNQIQELDAPLGHPADEQARQEVVATLKKRTDALKKRVKK